MKKIANQIHEQKHHLKTIYQPINKQLYWIPVMFDYKGDKWETAGVSEDVEKLEPWSTAAAGMWKWYNCYDQ